MSSKLLLLIRSLILKNIRLLFFLISFSALSQNTVTRIHTDWKGYWTSNTTTGVGNRPDRENNLLAFTWAQNGKTYSTGVNDNTLTANTVTFSPQKFRALKIQSIGIDPSMYILQGSMIDESATGAILTPKLIGATATGAELASRLTDGPNGLALGTGIANIKAGTAEFKIGTNNLNLTGLNDDTPDLIVTQVAEPGSAVQADKFKFIDASGNTVGNELSVFFGSASVPAVGTYSLDLFKMDGTYGFTPAATRDIRMLGIETSSFGITAANAAQVDRFVVTFSGSSDCAFIAFNTKSLKIAELKLVATSSILPCGKLGDTVNYTYEITNNGEVPITNIQISDPNTGVTISGNPIASLAVGAKATLTGTYVVTSADVAAGRIVNSPKVTGTDPSLNTVEDTPLPIETILLATPTIDKITNTTCSALGSVVLTNLPSAGTWSLTRSPGAVVTTGTGATATITGLPVGNYTFRVTNSTGCQSPATATVPITNQSATTWNGTVWSGGTPDITKNVVFAGAYTIASDLEACSCTINSGVNLLVPAGRTLTVTNALNVNSGATLTFENNSSLLQDSNVANTGNITYKRTSSMRLSDFEYWSTPVKPQKLVDVSPLTLSDKYFGFNGDNWVITSPNDVMTIGKGYIIRGPQNYSNTVRADFTADFKGVPNNGNLSGETLEKNKFYLIGNPYPSALSANEFLKANNFINGTFYFWTHNTPLTISKKDYDADDYAVFNLTGGVATEGAPTGDDAPGNNPFIPQGHIAAGQSFFASTNDVGTVVFTNKMREGGANNSQFFKHAKTAKETEKSRIWLNITNDKGAFKQMLVGYIDGATNGIDNRYDGESFDANPYLDFYSINNDLNYVIQGRALPFTDTDIVPLGYRSTIEGDFAISIQHTDGELVNQPVYIEDKATGIIHNLKNGKYTFTTKAGTFGDRLVLRYTDKTLGTGDFENTENNILVSVKNKAVKVTSAKENIKEVTIYDISGKLLYSKKKVSATELQITNLQSANQVLLVKVTLDNEHTLTKKVIFQ
ncbi:T9SS sorting signal type C domain-containing protein [Flavobacterium sp. ENC]|uniref:DUF7507 domain-containing protein n=1 Tax=Flavobacterium sp. ENC TaxID=2897330 RepID=UPI001E2D1870|nr:T9SS sorting signal type C domain-containing protein [Flavobacterium sp. ENC]MCD0464567.1 T9SS sorting signal type C domain-containing protein [Flavobacterium sp. ENC]